MVEIQIYAAEINVFWLATGYLTLKSHVLNDHVVTEKLLLHFRGVKQLACIKHRKQLRRLIKTTEEETLISEAQWKKRLVFGMGHKDSTKVTWSDESRFVFFQNDQWIRQIKWCIHMHLLYKPVGATLMIRGSFTWSDPGSVNMPPKKLRSPDYLNTLNDPDFLSIDFFSSLMAQAYFKMAC